MRTRLPIWENCFRGVVLVVLWCRMRNRFRGVGIYLTTSYTALYRGYQLTTMQRSDLLALDIVAV